MIQNAANQSFTKFFVLVFLAISIYWFLELLTFGTFLLSVLFGLFGRFLNGPEEKIFLPKNLHISKKSSTFAADFKRHSREWNIIEPW